MSIPSIPEDSRISILPIARPDIWAFYKKLAGTHWWPEKVTYGEDKTQWRMLNENDQYTIKLVIAYFVGSDAIVADNLTERFISEIQIPEVKYFYQLQVPNENVHSETYSTLVEQYVEDLEEREQIYNAIKHLDSVKHKADWAIKWTKSERSLAERLLAFICVEGIFFSSSFCIIFWVKEKGILRGLTESNEYINADEGLHTRFGIHLFGKCTPRPSNEIIKEIFRDAVEVEKKFVEEALPVDLVRMNKNLMKTYVESVADNLLAMIGVEPIYGSKNPFSFMDKLSLVSKANFFEKDNTSYAQNTGNNKQQFDATGLDLSDEEES